MKKIAKFLSLIFLTAIYCYGISHTDKSMLGDLFKDPSQTQQEQYFSESLSPIFCHTAQSKSSVNQITSVTVPIFMNLLDEAGAIQEKTEQFFETIFRRYSKISLNFPIKFRKENILFPFHYFW